MDMEWRCSIIESLLPATLRYLGEEKESGKIILQNKNVKNSFSSQKVLPRRC